MKTAEPASIEYLAELLKRCLEEGHSIRIERLGTFGPGEEDRFSFTPTRKPRVFIAYAAEDHAVVDRLCDMLEAHGFDAWLDRRKLLPGQNWPRTIERAIQMADFFIACLSRRSLLKRGTFQAEMRHAMDCAAKVPLDHLFFMPVRLDDCRVPPRIASEVQYVDLFPDFDRGARRLASTIRTEWERRTSDALQPA